MMAVITLSSKTSNLSDNLNRALELDRNRTYEIGLVNLWTCNSIPNISPKNCRFKYGEQIIDLDTGSYEIVDIISALKTKLNIIGDSLIIEGDPNTMKVGIYSNKEVDLSHENSLGKILGFDRVILEPNTWHYSKYLVSISQISTIIVSCNLACGSYADGEEKHIIYEFLPKVPAGYMINETPTPIIYVPINTYRIQFICVSITDQEGSLIDFRGDTITVKLHIREKR